ncbi:FKBP-type peptidyl-prolyl cis-trans isomerase [Aliidiomarina indica]|uniref:FKBP-type peptidyl-prolyl cis-trans isomerase n=1 Tax=Aliidiomarina indica TaxID=2749147 RepID=UPI002F3E4450
MKLMTKLFLVVAGTALLAACGPAPDRINLDQEHDARSYAVGAASLREAQQLIALIAEENPEFGREEKNELLHVGFVDILNRKPRMEEQMLSLELMVRGLQDAPAMADLPAIVETTLDEDDTTSQVYMLGAYMGLQVLMVDNLLQDYDKGISGRIAAIAFRESLKEEGRMTEEEITVQWEAIRDILTSPAPGVDGIMSENHALGLAYLEENAKRDGVIITDSGLQYEVLEEGDGVSPTASDIVIVHYQGWLVTGELFDSSVERNQTASFPLNRVIAGWTEGIQLMQVGAKYRFVIPHELAYADTQRGPMIAPYSALIFEVELIDVVSTQAN